ncbi:MAG: hypothetical protein OMM_14007, partial [Candidatus Magnetoglobus multicellularis str. Araruama]
MDRVGADFYEVYKQINEKLQTRPIPIQLPVGTEDNFQGVVDLISQKALIFTDKMGAEYIEQEVPEDMKDLVSEYRVQMIEAAAEANDDLMLKYLEGEELSEKEIIQGLREQTIANKIVPMLCGTSLKNKGVQPLLDAVVELLPSPLEVPPVVGVSPETGADDERKSSIDEPFSALAFKVATDPYVGRLTFIRIYSGILSSGSYVYNSSSGKKERIGRLVQMHSNSRKEIDEAQAGDIAAAIGLKNTGTGDT